MSLPNSEPLPENINDLPPARQRHIRRQPRAASLAERQLLMDSLLSLTAPNLNFFLFSLLGAITLGAALYVDDPAILLLALTLLPFLNPAFGLALLPASRKGLPGLKSLISLLILIVLNFGAGVLAGYLRKDLAFSNLALFRFSAPYWLDLALVGFSAVLAVFIMVRKGTLPRLVGVLLSYEILAPLAVAGFSFPLGASRLFPGALWISLTHLGLLIFLAAVTFFILGFSPNRLGGWASFLIPAALMAVGLLLNPPILPGLPTTKNDSTATHIPIAKPTNTAKIRTAPSETATFLSPTKDVSPTQTQTPLPTETQTPTQTRTSTSTQTPEPTSFFVNVEALTGAVIRESPSFDAPVSGYLNNGDSVEIFGAITEDGNLWYQVTTLDGQTGWLLGSLVNTQTPTPEPD